jgi:ABC-type xylose transport system permease subunit
MSGTFSFGKGWELDVIAAVVVGGTSFTGGAGKISGTFVGILFMAVISNGMTLLNIDIHTQYIVKAVIVFLAVLLSSYRAQLKA